MALSRAVVALALWGLVAVLGWHAYLTAAYARALDARAVWAVPVCLFPYLGGLGLVAWLRRRGGGWVALDATRHGLCLLVVVLAIAGAAHVAPQTSISVLREQIPSFFAWLFPLASVAAPLLLSRTAARLDAAGQALVLVAGATTLSGALVLLEPPAALGLGLVAFLLQWAHGPGRKLAPSALGVAAGVCVLLLTLATLTAHDRLLAEPAWSWLAALSLLGLALARREDPARDAPRILGSSVVVALLVAVCGVLLTAYLARAVHPSPALDTRLTLFRQHPNFLGSFFAVHAVLALGLGLAGGRSRWLWWAGALLLSVSTVMTDSRTGQAALVGGVAVLVLLPLLRKLLSQRLARLGLWAGAALLLAALAGVFVLGLTGAGEQSAAGRRAHEVAASVLDRFEKSLDFRLDAWRNSVAILRASPVLGIGPGTFLSVARFEPGSRFFNEPESPHPHNVLLYVAQSGGVLALLSFLVWLVLLVRGWWRLAADVRTPAAGAIAALAALLLANALDLGLALDTVVPAPMFALTGLALALQRAPAAPRRAGPRPGPLVPFLVTLGAAALLVSLSWQPLLARARVVQAELLAYDANWRGGDERRMALARRSLRTAVETHPVVPRAHDLLARWLENEPGGFVAARQVLVDLLAVAPHDGKSRSLLAHLYQRAELWEQAASELRLSLLDSHGSVHQSRDRADLVVCLARAGRRDEALAALVDALSLDRGVIAHVPWQKDGSVHWLPVSDQPPLELSEAVSLLYARHVADHTAGRPVGRRNWMDLMGAYRDAGRDDLALGVLAFLRENVTSIEPETLLSEQAKIALDNGRLDEARDLFRQAYEVSRNDFFLNEEARVARRQGETAAAEEKSRAAIEGTGEILDLPTAFRDYFNTSSESALAQGYHLAAADFLRRTLLFEDDVLARAALWRRVGRLALEGGDSAASVAAFAACHEHLTARPFPLATLSTGDLSTLPQELAADAHAAWRASGLDRPAEQQAAWSLPLFFAARQGASLFRLGFYEATGQVDALLREAELQLLEDSHHQPAMWARLAALEAFGRRADAEMQMRLIAEEYGRSVSIERAWEEFLRQTGQDRLADAEAWFDAGVLQMLRGYYTQAADMFRSGSGLAADQPDRQVRLLTWEARACSLAGRVDDAREALRRALELSPEDPFLRLRLESLP